MNRKNKESTKRGLTKELIMGGLELLSGPDFEWMSSTLLECFAEIVKKDIKDKTSEEIAARLIKESSKAARIIFVYMPEGIKENIKRELENINPKKAEKISKPI